MRNFPGDFDLSGMDPPPTPFEIGAALDAAAEYDAEAEAGGGAYDADAQAAADWVSSLSDEQFADLMSEYEADAALADCDGPELAGADPAGVIDLAGDLGQIDAMLAGMTDREHQRQVQDAEGRRRRSGPHHQRPTAEVTLANALDRVGRGTYLYGQQPAGLANWQGGTDMDAMFAAGPALNAAEIADRMRYELTGGAKPQGRGQFLPPVQALSKQIGLRP